MTKLIRKKLFVSVLLLAGLSLAVSQAQAQVNIPGFLKFEAYNGITGNPVQSLLDETTKYPNKPDEVLYMPSFDSRTVYPSDSHEAFGARISGFITPIESGQYEFFIRSDDASQLFLSTDDNPANLQQIAEETGCCGGFEETGATETSAPVQLQAGKRYAIQALYKEGTGGDFCQVAWRKVGDSTPASSLQPIPAAFLSVSLPAKGTVTITKQPANATAAQNDTVTFSVEATGTESPFLIQWQKNGVFIPRKTGASLSLGPLPASDNNAKIRAVVSIPGATANSSEATLTVSADKTPPTIKSVLGSDTFDSVTVEFSEAVTAASAGAAANYSLDGGLTVSAAALVNPTTVKLTTSKQTRGANYNLTVKNIADTAGLTSAADTKKAFSAFDYVRGGLKFEAYTGIGGNAVQGLLDDPKYPGSPDIVGYVSQFTSRLVFPDSSHESYGGRISGWIVPAETAQYEFFLRSDDASQLFLSPDDNPANAVSIAEETGCCGAFEEPGATETSAPVSLTAGKRYAIYALWKEGGGGDYCDVAWRKVGNSAVPRALPYIQGAVLETLAAPGTFTPPTISISSPNNGAAFAVKAPVTFVASPTPAAGKTVTKVEFFEQGKLLGTATSSPYSITLVDLKEDAHIVSARVTDSAGIFTDSAPITISVGGQVQKITLFAIDDKTLWRYDRSGADLGTAWREPKYDDSKWPQGKALIADESTTTVEPIRTPISRFNDNNEYVRTFYFRGRFSFSGATTGAKLQLRHVVDDGAVFYLNGTEVLRFGIPAGDVNFQTDASGHENAYEGPIDIPANLLVQGENVFAVEVHQSGGSSSDMVFGAELVASVPVTTTTVTLVAVDDKTTWRYDRSGADLGTAWRDPKYDDSKWPQGKALIADETTTTVEPIRTPISRFNDNNEYVRTFYFRTHFNFPAASTAGAKLKLRHAVDDGVVIYLNGVEINRLGITGDVNFQTDASGHENAWEGPFDIPITNLLPGDNVLAAEVHQSGGSSSDMVFGAELIATIPGGATPPPAEAPKFTKFTRNADGSISIEWTGGGTLQAAASVTGPWQDVPGATSPYKLTPTAGAPTLFGRIKK
ncbi:MAG: hypothetical protein FJ398_08005 [Verrucomicrobia bacterium]|nr:hypothetical protein [Verrucomicrobiota bacterium]